ncbi:MAG: RNA pseudouridine synthase [Oligoflexia bacterium]|nr:RNA pseudouridine synthase [Oligoflexia bacterium]
MNPSSYKITEIGLSWICDFASLEDALLATIGISRSAIKKVLSRGRGNWCQDWRRRLKMAVKRGEQFLLPIDLINYYEVNPEYCGPDIEILADDQYFLVLEKPPSVHCHPFSYSEKSSCLNYIRTIRPQLLMCNLHCHERGLLYRLDYETSGVLIYVKRQDIYDKLLQQGGGSNPRGKEKIYLAVVAGNFAVDSGRGTDTVCRSLFYSSGTRGEKMKVLGFDGDFLAGARAKELREGELRIVQLDYNQEHNLSLLKIFLNTGIRHQIRAQLAHLGHPILGDKLYDNLCKDKSKSKSEKNESGIGSGHGELPERMFLHAYCYSVMLEQKEYIYVSNHIEIFERYFKLSSY